MLSVDDFFIPENNVNYISEDEYKQTISLIRSLDAVARMTYHSIYIIDYYKKEFLYVSENPLFLCGLQSHEVKEMGYAFYLNHVPKEELNMLLEINRAGFAFLNKVSTENRIKYTISYDFHLLNINKKTLINHKITPLMLTPEGDIWLTACVVSLSSHQRAGHIEARKIGEIDYWTYSIEGRRWKQERGLILNDREKEILSLSAQGSTMNDIAHKLYIGVDTIKFHKRRLFEKLNVNNIAEALSVVSNYRMM